MVGYSSHLSFSLIMSWVYGSSERKEATKMLFHNWEVSMIKLITVSGLFSCRIIFRLWKTLSSQIVTACAHIYWSLIGDITILSIFFKKTWKCILIGSLHTYSIINQCDSSSGRWESIYFKIHLYHAWANNQSISFYHEYPCSIMLISALFLTAKNWKQSNLPQKINK